MINAPCKIKNNSGFTLLNIFFDEDYGWTAGVKSPEGNVCTFDLEHLSFPVGLKIVKDQQKIRTLDESPASDWSLQGRPLGEYAKIGKNYAYDGEAYYCLTGDGVLSQFTGEL